MNILEIGIAKGEEIGMAKGEEIGMAKGKEIGMAKGEEIGMEKGEARVNHLIKILINQARTDEIEKAVTDKDFQQTLFAEFGI